MINEELLYKFFKGVTTVSEDTDIKKWIEESEENKKGSFRERKLYDSTLLNKKTLQANHIKSKQKKTFRWSTFINVAALLLFLITAGLLINKQFENRNRSNQLNTLIVPT